MKRRRAIIVLRKSPHWPFIRQQVHVEGPAAAARTNHCGLFEESIILDDVESSPL
jgi:hypothetical protein